MGQSCQRDRRYSRLIEKYFGQKLSKKTGNVPMPNLKTETLLGEHAVVCVVYNDNTQQ